jgi:ADP-heptose:LPS heptosyltransferase
MGDVALATPVIRAMRIQYPDTEIVLLTRRPFNTFFYGIEGITIITADFKGRHNGFSGLIRLYKDISAIGRINYVIDLHDVLRTVILRFFFWSTGVPVLVIDKDRKRKMAVITGKSKVKLTHTVDRYKETFVRAGFNITLLKEQSMFLTPGAMEKASEVLGDFPGLKIGVAPYAKHDLKMWPDGNMVNLLKLISEEYPSKFWLFGGREEKDKLEDFEKRTPGSVCLCGKLSLEEELAVMSRLDLMIAMDSSNMHMAALSGTRVISVWGGTDPLTGFGAWMQPEDRSVRIPVDELTCRPCTIYGKGTCRRGDFACMNWLTPEKVFEEIKKTGVLAKLPPGRGYGDVIN